MSDFLVIIPAVITLIVVDFLYSQYPAISRKTLSFGISVPESIYNEPELIRMRASYKKLVLLCSIPFIAAVVLASVLKFDGMWTELFPAASIVINLLVNTAVYLGFHKKMKELKAKRKWTEDSPQLIAAETGFRRQNTLVSPWWFCVFGLFILITIVTTLSMYESLPDKLIMQIDKNGQPATWADKSWTVLSLMPLTQIFLTVIFVFAYNMLNKSRLQIDPANREKTLEQNRIARHRWSVFIVITGLGVLTMTVLGQFSLMNIIPHAAVAVSSLVIFGIILFSVAIISIKSGQSGNRIKIKDSGNHAPVVRDDDKYWKFGMFYYNPDDAGLFIEKRMGIGWTMNWGRPMSWVLLTGLILFIAGYSIYNSMIAR